MINPLDTIQKFRSRLGKPIRPVVEIQSDASVVNIVTNSIQDGNVIRDFAHDETWLKPTEAKTTAIYIDGVFKGMGYYASEEGIICNLQKDVTLEREVDVVEENGEIKKEIISTYNLVYKGVFSKLIDAKLLEMGSALKSSMTDKLIFAAIGLLFGFILGGAWG